MNEEIQKKSELVKKKSAKGFGLIETIIIIVVTAIISGITTGVILYNTYDEKSPTSYNNLTDDENFKEFLDIYNSVSNEYYKDINKEEMLEEAIKAMMDYLGDDYTTYLTEEETNTLSDTLSGKYKGIGISFKDKMVVEVFKDSPAEVSGIKVNDVITKVNNKDCTNLKDTEIVSLIKENAEKVNIVVTRNEKEYSYEIKLDSLNVPAITSDITEEKIGYIYISTFSNTLAEQVKEALLELEKKNMKSLIIDVRDNAGGYLVAASDVANLFLEEGKTIYSLQANNQQEIFQDKTEEKREYDIAVLINKNSASASEILAAALKESYGATLIGNISYGKGKVQQTKTLSNGKMVKYTTAKWLTPTNECIDGKGLIPDYEVDLKINYDENGNVVSYDDTQLEKAIAILSEK